MLPAKIRLTSTATPSSRSRTDSPTKKEVDFYIGFEDMIIPVSRANMQTCKLIAQQCQAGKKIILIDQKFSSCMLKKVIELLQGAQLELATMKQLNEFLEIADYLEAEAFIQQLQAQIEKDIQSYEIFWLLQLAYRFGLQKIFDLCISYLQFDGFEQIKYNRFDFLECDFKLFQIVLRRHHLLKIRGKIDGISVADIEEVIRMYCDRYKLDSQILAKLLAKYVHSLEKVKFFKNSLRLDKLAHKNIMQSANIETQLQETDKLIGNAYDFATNSFRKSASVRLNKYSSEAKKEVGEINLNYGTESVHFAHIDQQNDLSELDATDPKQSTYQIQVKNVEPHNDVSYGEKQLKDFILEKSVRRDNPFAGNPGELKLDEPEVMVNRISSLLIEYTTALEKHESNFENLRKNMRNSGSYTNKDNQHLTPKLCRSSYNDEDIEYIVPS